MSYFVCVANPIPLVHTSQLVIAEIDSAKQAGKYYICEKCENFHKVQPRENQYSIEVYNPPHKRADALPSHSETFIHT